MPLYKNAITSRGEWHLTGATSEYTVIEHADCLDTAHWLKTFSLTLNFNLSITSDHPTLQSLAPI